MNRREFLSRTAAGAAALVVASDVGAETIEKGKGRRAAGEQKPASGALPARLGTYYEAEVPDTLDLAERARLGVNHFTEIAREDLGYEMLAGGSLFNVLVCTSGYACGAKALEALAMERIMSGSQQNLEKEAKILEAHAALLGDDGLYYMVPTSGRKPWWGPEELRPFAQTHAVGRMMRAMIAWHQYTGDPKWKERIDRMVDGEDRLMVVHKDDYAYVPIQGLMPEEYFRSCYVKGRGWKGTDEPQNEKSGEEGSLFNHQGHWPGALANWHVLTGNKQALRLSGELVRFYTKPQFWADWSGGEYPGVTGADHAHWQGHWHGHINVLRAILEYAIATNDPRLKLFVRDGYEWARQPWLARIGFVTEQGCGIGRLIGLAVKLSYAGVGDYWEDVDQYVRNYVAAQQITGEDVLRWRGENVPPGEPHMTPDEVIRRLEAEGKLPPPPKVEWFQGPPEGIPAELQPKITGADLTRQFIGSISPEPMRSYYFLCCSPHGNMAFFYAWDGTLRYSDGVAQVNLLLNRASPWMDIDSYLPYEGKVVLKNKACREAFVRIPLWVEKKAVGCHVNGRIVRPEWFGRYLRIEHIQAGDVVTIEFAIADRREQWTTQKQMTFYPGWPGDVPRNYRFRGNTLIDISPPIPDGPMNVGSVWPMFQGRAEQYQASEAPMRQVTRFVTPLVLRW